MRNVTSKELTDDGHNTRATTRMGTLLARVTTYTATTSPAATHKKILNNLAALATLHNFMQPRPLPLSPLYLPCGAATQTK